MSHPQKKLRVLGVIPGQDESTAMWFSRRQVATVSKQGLASGCFFLRSRTNPLIILQEMRRLQCEIQAFKPDIVHAHFGTMTALVCALVSPVPVVVTYHGQDLNPSPGDPWLRTQLAHRLSHFAARRAAQIVCVSEGVRAHISYIQEPVHIVPCGIDVERFRLRSREVCREELGWQSDEKVVLFNAGSDPVRKRVDLANAAFAHAYQREPKLRLHVFGGGTHPDEMPLYFSAADCLLVTSDYEGSPMVVKEAMACNLPVVSVDVGDVAERLAGVWPAAIVARDAAALGDAVVEVVGTGCRSNGREAMHELSEEAVAKKLVAIYRLAAGVKPCGSLEPQPEVSAASIPDTACMRVA